MRSLLLGIALNAVLLAQAPPQPAAPQGSGTPAVQVPPRDSDEFQKRLGQILDKLHATQKGRQNLYPAFDVALLDRAANASRTCAIPLKTITPPDTDKKILVAPPKTGAVRVVQPPAPSCDEVKP